MMARYTQTGHRDRTSASGVYWATVLVALLLIGAPLSLAQSESSGKASGKWSPSRLFSRLLGATGGQSQPQSAQTWTINYNEDVQSLKAELKKLKEEVASLKRAAATSQTGSSAAVASGVASTVRSIKNDITELRDNLAALNVSTMNLQDDVNALMGSNRSTLLTPTPTGVAGPEYFRGQAPALTICSGGAADRDSTLNSSSLFGGCRIDLSDVLLLAGGRWDAASKAYIVKTGGVFVVQGAAYNQYYVEPSAGLWVTVNGESACQSYTPNEMDGASTVVGCVLKLEAGDAVGLALFSFYNRSAKAQEGHDTYLSLVRVA